MKINGAIGLGIALLVASIAGIALLVANPPARPPRPVVAAAEQTATAAPKPDERFVIKRILPISGPIKYGAWHWDEANVPAGPIVVTVDLEARVISVFRGGYEIGAAAVLLGTRVVVVAATVVVVSKACSGAPARGASPRKIERMATILSPSIRGSSTAFPLMVIHLASI